MEIIFLGTSSGTPTKSRNVSGIAVKKANSKSWQLIDCGEGTQHQILRTKLSLNSLEAIFITHVHGDHCYGLPGLLASATMTGRTAPLTIIGPAPIQEFVETTLKLSQSRLSYDLDFVHIEHSDGYKHGKDFNVGFTELSHRVPSYAFTFSQKNIPHSLNTQKLLEDGIESGPVWGQIQKGINPVLANNRKIEASDYLLAKAKPQKIIVAGDNDSPELLADAAKSASVLIHESTYTEDIASKVGNIPQHSSAKMIAQFAQQASIPNLILTHFSPRYLSDVNSSPSIHDISDEASKFYRGNLFLANDLDHYSLTRDDKLLLLTSQ